MILDDIVAKKRVRVEERKREITLNKLIKQCERANGNYFKSALQKQGISIIAEIKKASPSKGVILKDFDPLKIAGIYGEINIDAISVLTEEDFFQGRDEYLTLAKDKSKKPVLRKDFIIDEYQIFESRTLGADAILLIVSILQKKTKNFYKAASALGLDCLVEVHDQDELDIALKAGCEIIGINNRDLKIFSVDLKTTEKLLKYIPKGKVIVSESGINKPSEIQHLRSLGVDAVLIGETFMRSIDDLNSMKIFINQAKDDSDG
ncbi:indole-3-glycerol phosphate synthase [Oxobacter pfennigii]|uniref:Indole-3-glycerol phosphate synthase n=1 Tax=Oxobacter pfennigii TaxID=36849 RepID=A0A0P8W6G3_9CLOT|nr:indole-3-glycerol phosphate synthase TrpC [Oxobacter pfennigii]KPU43596.1 indole-3-glycerol phosphate synthase [Oxobacter pfennigii]